MGTLRLEQEGPRLLTLVAVLQPQPGQASLEQLPPWLSLPL